MAAILDYCVPSRRRERLERKERQALASGVDSRWGDAQITAPSEGGWNQAGSPNELEKDDLSTPTMTESGSSANTTPDLSDLYDKSIEAGIVIEAKREDVQLPRTKEDKKNITFTITLPWPSRKASSPTTSTVQSLKPASENTKASGQTSRPSTANSVPPVVYNPVSDRYIKDLSGVGNKSSIINPLTQSPPNHFQSSSPAPTYVSTSEDVGLVPSHSLSYGASHTGPVGLDLNRGRSPPLQHTSPIMRLEPIPATPYCVDNFSGEDPRLKRPSNMTFSQPPVVERHSRARSSSRGPAVERHGRMRSLSRGQAEDSSQMRSMSRGPSEDRTGTIRSSSRGPAPDRVGSNRSLSHGPAADRHTTRSSSRGPAVERLGRGRSSSVGPPPGRSVMVRSASKEPMGEREVYSQASRRDSSSSNGSSATLFSEEENDHPVRHQRADSKSATAKKNGKGGYYTSLASEYRQIAKDVENQALVDSEGSEGKELRKKTKERAKETFTGPQELVPNATDLYG